MVIRVVVDAKNVEKLLRRLPNTVKSEVGTSFQAKTKEIKNYAKSVAPYNRGRIRDAIYGLTYQQELKSIIGVGDVIDRGFNVTEWVTRQFPITIANPNQYFDAPQTFMYGDPGAKSKSGNAIQWSTTARWWEGVQKKARRSFPQVARAAVRRATK